MRTKSTNETRGETEIYGAPVIIYNINLVKRRKSKNNTELNLEQKNTFNKNI